LKTDEAERRQITILFCDLVGSTALSAELDPEDLREVVQAYQKTCAEAVRSFGGHVAQYLGDGLLIYFGFPQAFEDAAYRAVSCGLRVLASMEVLNEQLQRDRGIRLAVRLGLHTGLVVIGEMGGAGRHERLALGDAPNLAARIQGLADPDTLLISAATHGLVRDRFRCQDLGAQSVKGIERPVRVFRVLGTADLRGLPTSAGRAAVPLIGREEEMDLLSRAWEQAKDGHGQVALLSGEAGIGKSRLIQVLRERAEAGGELVELRGSALHAQTALHPLMEHLNEKLGWSEAEIQERLLASSNTETIPEAMASWLAAPSRERPRLLAWEDVHWLDSSSLEVLKALIERLAGLRILVLLSFRPDFQLPWSIPSSALHLRLERLRRQPAEKLIAAIAGGKRLPRELAHQIVARADGVPLFLEELTRTVLESGLLREADDRWELTGPLPSTAVPTSLHDSLMARLDRLGTIRSVVQVAATLGRELTYPMLRAASEVDEATLARNLAQLVEAEILRQEGERYIFRHALIQEVAYSSLLRSKRQELHRRIAEVLDGAMPPGAEDAALLAYHWSRAIDPQHPDPVLSSRAVGFLLKAGERGLRLSAYREALGHLEEGLGLLCALPEGPGRDELELAIQVLRSMVLKATRGLTSPEVKQVYDRARELCRRLGDRPELAQVLFGLWTYHLWHGEYERARELAEECFELARRSGDSDLLLEAFCALSNSLFWLGDFPASLARARQVLTDFPAEVHEAHRGQYGQDPRMIAYQFTIMILWLAGRPEEALAAYDSMRALVDESDHPFSTVIGLLTSLELNRRRDDAAATRRTAERLIELAREMGFPNFEVAGRHYRYWALAASGQAAEVAGPMLHSFRTSGPLVGSVAWAHTAASVAEVCWQAGQTGEAVDLLEEGLAWTRQRHELAYESELCCLKGEILSELSGRSHDPLEAARHRAGAEAALRQALHLAGGRWQILFARRAAGALAALLERHGRGDEARAALAELQRLTREVPPAVQRLLENT
jgi:class 3 adenylate cyclase/tetratricopeptide (TPR) repeat protein